MKCPLMLTYDVGEAPCEHPQPMECLQEECAWWDKVNGACAVFLISRGLYSIARDTVNIAKELTLIRPK